MGDPTRPRGTGVRRAIARQAQQLEQVIFANFSHRPAEQLAIRLAGTANPLGCAAALASLDLRQANPKWYQPFEARHTPLLEELGEASYLTPIGKRIQARCLEQGVYLRSLDISDRKLEQCYRAIVNSLAADT